jgi:uncharacterized membrane-anchored protein YitT (DUF2179 family)
MRIQLILSMLCVLLLCSCRTYLDTAKNSIVTDYMIFKCQKNYNELDYFNKVNASADKDIFYTTHFTINLPKNIIYWKQVGNKFYYEYGSKQVIYIYTAYKNEGKESDSWELKKIDKGSELKYLNDYWKERKYDENFFDIEKKNRVTKLYTNGKYEILLCNIKDKNFPSFFEFIKTFKVKS